MNKYTIAQILAAWEAAFGEDMMTEYPGFIQRLTEEEKKEDEQTTWAAQYQNISAALALARGPGPELQATSGKLQAPSCKLDKTTVQCYCIL